MWLCIWRMRRGAQLKLSWMNSISQILLTACCPLQKPCAVSPSTEYLLHGREPEGPYSSPVPLAAGREVLTVQLLPEPWLKNGKLPGIVCVSFCLSRWLPSSPLQIINEMWENVRGSTDTNSASRKGIEKWCYFRSKTLWILHITQWQAGFSFTQWKWILKYS